MAEAQDIGDEAVPRVGLPEGAHVGKYVITGRVGAGGQAIVYKGYDALLDRDVAIKQISSHLAADPQFLERFRREAQILARLGSSHPNIVAVHELVEDESGLFMVMEFVSGHTLRAVLDHQEHAVPVQAALEIIWHIGSGLRAAHGQGIVHRDIKPSNIIVMRNFNAKIMDFGVAARQGGEESMALGTTKYMAPELFGGGQVDARSDIYSLGFIAYEMLTGRSYFSNLFHDVVRDPHSESLRWMKWHADKEMTAPFLSEINPKVPAPLAEIVGKMMAKEVSERYGSIDEAMKDLRKAYGVQRPTGGRTRAVEAARAQADGAAPGPGARVPVAIAADGAPAEALALPDDADADDAGGEEKTAAIPKVPLSPRTKLILAISAGVLAIAAGIVVAVVLRGRGAEHEAQGAALFKAATGLYENAGKAYFNGDVGAARAGYEEARGKYEQFVADFSDLGKGLARAEARQSMCKAYLAMLNGEWTAADTACEEAKKLKVLDLGETNAFGKEKEGRQAASACLTAAEKAIEAGQYETAREQLTAFDSLPTPPVDLRNGRRRLADDALIAAETQSRTAQLLAEGDVSTNSMKANLRNFQMRLSTGGAALSTFESSLSAAELVRAAADIKAARVKYDAVGDAKAVTDRLATLKAAEGYVASLTEYGRAVSAEGLTPLKKRQAQIANVVVIENRLQGAQAAGVDLGGPKAYGPFVDMLKLLRAEEAYERGLTLTGQERKAAFTESLTYRKLPKVAAALAEMEASAKRQSLLDQAGKLKLAGKHAEVVALLEASPLTASDTELSAMLADAKVSLYLALGDAARTGKRWEEALGEYEKARLAKPNDAGVIMEIERRVVTLGEERKFYDFLTRGRELLEAKQYKQAVEMLAEAEAGAEGLMGVPKAEATRLKTRGRYEWALADGDEAMANGHLEDARAQYLRAQRHARSLVQHAPQLMPEVAERIARVEKEMDRSPE